MELFIPDPTFGKVPDPAHIQLPYVFQIKHFVENLALSGYVL
jgi:hypothetical protein